MYLDLFFNLQEDELDKFLEDVEKELEEAKKDDVIIVDLVIETDINKYKNFYEEIPLNRDFEAKKDEVIDLVKNEIEGV